jgi:hypothetical protein
MTATAGTLRFKVVALTVVAALALMAPAAWAAHSVTQGVTFYSDGTQVKTIAFGQDVTIYATGAKPSTEFDVVTGVPTSSRADGVDGGSVPVPTYLCGTNLQRHGTVTSSSQGDIPVMHLPVGRLPGTYKLCFYERVTDTTDPSATATLPVWLTIVL